MKIHWRIQNLCSLKYFIVNLPKLQNLLFIYYNNTTQMGDLRQFTVVNVKLVVRMKTKVVGNVKILIETKEFLGV